MTENKNLPAALMGEKEKYPTIEDFLKAQSKSLTRQATFSFFLVVIFLTAFALYIFKESLPWLFVTFVLGPLAFSSFYAAMKNTENLSLLQKQLQLEVVKERIALCVLIGNNAPKDATRVRFHPLDKSPVEKYTPIQWWDDEKALLALTEDTFKEVEVFKESLQPWLSGVFQDSVLVSLDKVFHDLFALEELGAVEEVERLQED